MSFQKAPHAFLILLTLHCAGGIDEDSARPNDRRGAIENSILNPGERVQILRRQPPPRIRVARERPRSGAGGIDQHPIDRGKGRRLSPGHNQSLRKPQPHDRVPHPPDAPNGGVTGDDSDSPPRQYDSFTSGSRTEVRETFPGARSHEVHDGSGGRILDHPGSRVESADRIGPRRESHRPERARIRGDPRACERRNRVILSDPDGRKEESRDPVPRLHHLSGPGGAEPIDPASHEPSRV